MVYKIGKKKKKQIPKVSRVVNTLADFLDSGHSIGTNFGMTRLKKSIEELEGESPHVDTIRAKLTEGFEWKKVLQDWEDTRRSSDNSVNFIKKVEQKEVNMATIMDLLLKLEKEIKEINKKIKR